MAKSANRGLSHLAAILSISAVALAALCLKPMPAGADATPYASIGFCDGVTLGGYGGCNNPSPVLTYQAYGWGENHSVCVWLNPYNPTRACSGGPNQGVYSGTIATNYAYPYIENNAAGDNRVHGVYFN